MQSVTQLPVKRDTAPGPAAEATRHPLSTLRREVDRLFDDFASGWASWPFGRRLFDQRLFEPRLWDARASRDEAIEVNMPSVDIEETEKAYRISAEMPGVDEKDIEVSVSDEMLTLRGEKKQSRDEQRKGYEFSERAYGLFERSFSLPSGVDANAISASFSRGVLTVELPKTPEAQRRQPRRIAVKSS
ncbi:MAG: Hsp20/alpha crystallin family protein [Betaproteobacteria bacterium]|nr:Hsp20/alpha crystallin family protein [Betaproteobacteria bacterium]